MAPIQFENNGDNYSDDDDVWNDLSESDLVRAEQDATAKFQATQGYSQSQRLAPLPTPPPNRQPEPEVNYIDDDDDDEDYGEVTNEEVVVPPPIQRLPVQQRQPITRQLSNPMQMQESQTQPYRSIPGGSPRVLNQPSRYPTTNRITPSQQNANPQYKRPVPVFNSEAGGWTQSQQIARQVQYPLSSQSQRQVGVPTPQSYATTTTNTTATFAVAGSDGIETLRKQLEELRAEKERAQSELLAKSGEVSLVRTNAERSAKAQEAEIERLKQLNAKAADDAKKAIEDAKRAEEIRKTELEFVKRDLGEEARKVRELERKARAEKEGKKLPLRDGAPGTPTKREKSFRDGFDDDEMSFISPTKLAANTRQKSLTSTTSSPRKKQRKRKAVDSPINVLDIEEEPQSAATSFVATSAPLTGNLTSHQLAKLKSPTEDLKFLEAVLDHTSSRTNRKTLEDLTHFHFPSNPSQSLTSILLSSLKDLNPPKPPPNTTLPRRLTNILVWSLWDKCEAEEYFEPLPLIVELVTFCLELGTSEVAPQVSVTLLPVAQSTVLRIANPLFRHRPLPAYADLIDVDKILDLIYLTLLGCAAAPTSTAPATVSVETTDEVGNMVLKDEPYRFAVTEFWRNMSVEFVLTMLSIRQPMRQFGMVCRMLPHSVTPSSFGPIQVEGCEDISSGILERMSYLLIHSPAVLQPKTKTTATKKPPLRKSKQGGKELARLRLQIITTLRDFSTSPAGSLHIVTHPTVIARIATFLSSTLDNLYSFPSHHRVLASSINVSVELLHYLFFAFPDLDLRSKLDVVQGGFSRWQLTLARLNSAERSRDRRGSEESQETVDRRIGRGGGEANVLLGGLKDSALDRAQQLLEECVTMEEGESLEETFWSGGGPTVSQ